jgi:hypothetical protein
MTRRFYRLIALSVLFNFLTSQFAFAQEKVFFGNLHSHTSYSDGSGAPREAFDYARRTAGIRFLALTEHNHAEATGGDGISIATDNALYKGSGANSLISATRSLSQDGQFIVLYGQEFSTISSGNHINVFDIGEVINVEKGRFDRLLTFLQTNRDSSNQPAVMLLNHPEESLTVLSKEYGLDDFGGNISTRVSRMGTHAPG